MTISTPNTEMSDGTVGAGRIEVSKAEDGSILLSAMGDDGLYQWYKLSVTGAVGLSAALATCAHSALQKGG